MSSVTLTESAAYEVKDMLEANDMVDGFLRFKVQGGGCTGLTYGMAAENEAAERDEIFEYHGVKMLVDKMDLPVVDGTVIDFKQSLIGGVFTNFNSHLEYLNLLWF